MSDILLIDDNPDLLDLEVALVKSAGHSPMIARNGKEGMRLFMAHRFDLVVTDIVMPEMEGLETIQQMKRLRRDAKIIAVSGESVWHTETYLRLAHHLGATEILPKPFSGKRFLALVAAVLARESAGVPMVECR